MKGLIRAYLGSLPLPPPPAPMMFFSGARSNPKHRSFTMDHPQTADLHGLRALGRAQASSLAQASAEAENGQCEVLQGMGLRNDPEIFPRISSPSCCFAFLGSPLFSTNQANNMCFCWGPSSIQEMSFDFGAYRSPCK